MGLVLVVLILVYLLLGAASGDYVISVMANVSLFVSAVTPQAIIGAALVFGLVNNFLVGGFLVLLSVFRGP